MGVIARLVFVEVTKMARKKSTLMSLSLMALIPLLLYSAIVFGGKSVKVEGPSSSGYFLIVMTLGVIVAFLGPLLASLAGSDLMTGEKRDGTLRYIMIRPVSRGGILLAKSIALFILNLTMVISALIAALAVGYAFMRMGTPVLPSNEKVELASFLGRMVLSALILAVGLTAVSSLSVLIGLVSTSAVLPVALTLGFLIGSKLVGGISSVKDFLLTTHLETAQAFFDKALIPWGSIRGSSLALLAYIAIFISTAMLVYRRQDF